MLTSYLRTIGIVLLGFAWLSYDHYRPWVNFHGEALALLGIGLLAAGRCSGRDLFFGTAPRIVGWVGATALVPWLQYFFGVSLFAGDALVVSLYLCGLGAAIWLGHGYVTISQDKEAGLTAVFYMLWVVALASAAIGLLQWLTLQEALAMYAVQTDAGDRAMGNLGQPNQLATLLLMGIAALAWTFERKRIGPWGLLAGVAFMTMVLVLAQSRAGMLSALAVTIFLIWRGRTTAGSVSGKYVLAWFVAYGVAIQLLPYVSDWLLMGSPRDMNLGADSARVTIWKQIVSAINQSPWVGYGWNQTPTAHSAGSVFVPGSLTYTNAHNVILDLLAWNGIPIGLMLTGACAYWLVSRMRRTTGVNAIYGMACLLPVAVHSMVEYPFAYSYFLLTAGLMVGIVEASHQGVKTFKLGRRWVGSALAIWCLLGSYMAYEYLLIEEDFRIVRFENLRIGKTPAEYEVPNVWMLSHMRAMLKAARLRAQPGMSADDLENLRKASLRFPYGSLSLRYAQSLGLNGDPSGATRQMAIIRGMYGEYYYQAAVNVLRAQQEEYPELSKVVTP